MARFTLVRLLIISTALASSSVLSAQTTETTPKPPEWRVNPPTLDRLLSQGLLQPKKTWPGLPGPSVQGFSVVLVLGDLQGGTTAENLPAAARKALADMNNFLPYKSYRLLDTAWVLGSAPTNVTIQLRGPGNEAYEVSLIAEAEATTAAAYLATRTVRNGVKLRFLLTESGRGPDVTGSADRVRRRDELDEQGARLEAERSALESENKALRQRVGERHPDVIKTRTQLEDLNRRIASLKAQTPSLGGGGRLIDTSFAMDVGETVVVGTSRTRDGADKALVALLTAVPKTLAK